MCPTLMHTLAVIVPKILREKGDLFFKVLKGEQMGEKLHKNINDLENNFRNVIDKPKKSFLKIRRYEINNSADKLCYPSFS